MKLQRNRVQPTYQSTKETDLFPETNIEKSKEERIITDANGMIVSNYVKDNEILCKLAEEEDILGYQDMTAAELFKAIFRKNIHRNGAEELLKFIESTDFFTAPASTRFHGSYEGGLVQHSLHVYFCYKGYIKTRGEKEYGIQMSTESIALVSLLHDLCKANVYKIEMRNKKIDGVWKQVPTYVFEDDMPLGHGPKSAYLVTRYCELNPIEYACIAFHMGAFDANDVRTVGSAFEMYPEAFVMSLADQEATYFLENEKWKNRKTT